MRVRVGICNMMQLRKRGWRKKDEVELHLVSILIDNVMTEMYL
jgi:hypothetical protein